MNNNFLVEYKINMHLEVGMDSSLLVLVDSYNSHMLKDSMDNNY
jgi:hypothetical protein